MLQRLAGLRKNKNWSMQETADRLGIAKSTYAGYESGYREPPLRALCQIADLFETTVDDLLEREKKQSVEIDLVTISQKQGQSIMMLDSQPLTSEEIASCIAFVRYRREISL